jgi:hypothetical protein
MEKKICEWYTDFELDIEERGHSADREKQEKTSGTVDTNVLEQQAAQSTFAKALLLLKKVRARTKLFLRLADQQRGVNFCHADEMTRIQTE